MNTAAPGRPGARLYPWFVVLALCIAAIVSYIDRQVINLLVEPIKADFGINDTQIGLLQGFSFVLFYACLSIPLARLADTGKRTRIIFVGVLCWSLATFSCGLAGSFAVLFAARMFVGVGEATLTPAGYSLISDYFPRERISIAISVFTGSGFVGSGIAYLFGGVLVDYFSSLERIVLPLVGERSVWQATFMAVTLPSALVIVLLLFVREPPRRETVASATTRSTTRLRDVFLHLRDNARLFCGVLLGLTMMAAAGYATNLWVPTYFIRVHEWSPLKIGSLFGITVIIASAGGVFFGGAVAAALMRRGHSAANLTVPLIAGAAAIPFAVAFPLVPSAELSFLVMIPVLFLGVVPFGCGTAVLPIISPNRMRAQVVAVYLLIANIIGFTAGPTSVGALTDYLFGDPGAINYSLSISPALFLVTGCALVLWAIRPYTQLIEQSAD